jgi:hypothetical protein
MRCVDVLLLCGAAGAQAIGTPPLSSIADRLLPSHCGAGASTRSPNSASGSSHGIWNRVTRGFWGGFFDVKNEFFLVFRGMRDVGGTRFTTILCNGRWRFIFFCVCVVCGCDGSAWRGTPANRGRPWQLQRVLRATPTSARMFRVIFEASGTSGGSSRSSSSSYSLLT